LHLLNIVYIFLPLRMGICDHYMNCLCFCQQLLPILYPFKQARSKDLDPPLKCWIFYASQSNGLSCFQLSLIKWIFLRILHHLNTLKSLMFLTCFCSFWKMMSDHYHLLLFHGLIRLYFYHTYHNCRIHDHLFQMVQ